MPITGRPSLAYVGVNSPYPPNMQTYNRIPTTRDSQNFTLGDFWLVKNSHIAANENLYYLASLANGIATWVLIAAGGHGEILSLTGNSGGAVFGDAANNINVVGDATTVTVAGNPGTNTLTISAINSTQQFTGDTGAAAVPLAGVIQVRSGIAAGGVADNLLTVTPGTGNQVIIALHNSINQPNTNNTGTTGMYQLNSVNFMHNYGTGNTWLGAAAGNLTLTVGNATSNTGIGALSLSQITTGAQNTAVGGLSGTVLTTGSENTLIGYDAGGFITTGSNNTVVCGVGPQITTGSNNIILGNNAGSNYTTGESSNIIVGNSGIVAESNTIRIGTQGAAAGQQNRAFCAGITGVVPANANPLPVVVDSAGQLGTGTFYATGTFTPILSFGGASTGITYTSQIASYTKIGNLVFVDIYVVLSSKGSSTGAAVISALPYISDAALTPAYASMYTTGQNLTLNANYTFAHGYFVNNTTTMSLQQDAANGSGTINITDTNFANNTAFGFHGWYHTPS